MSRPCNYLAPSTGAPCTQVVADHEDHCAAGHPCPPVASAPTGGAQSAQVSSAAGVGEIDDLLGDLGGAQTVDDIFAVPEETEEERAARDLVRAVKRLPALEATTPDSLINYLGTERSTRLRSTGETMPTRLDRYLITDGPSVVTIARGRYTDSRNEWYLETGCHHEGGEPCEKRAYVRLKGARYWSGPSALPAGSNGRKAVFGDSIMNAKATDPRCDLHREHPVHSDNEVCTGCGDTITGAPIGSLYCGECLGKAS